MKPTTRAIVILSALLVLAGGWIIYSQIAGDRALKSAQEKVKSAQDANVLLEASNAELKKSRDAKDAENKRQAVTIGAQKAQIAHLKAQVGKAGEIAGITVSEGADLKETYDAGKPIVKAAEIPALNEWYSLMGIRIDPLLASLAALQIQVGIMGPKIIGLEASNADILASNGRLQVTIDADSIVLSDQHLVIDSQALNLKGAQAYIKVAIGRAQLGETLAWTFGGATAGAISGAALGKDALSSTEGALIGAGVGFVAKWFSKFLFH